MTGEPELPHAVALAWGVAAAPQRGPKRELSIERIVETAVELADAGGLAAVSMSAVAAALGFTPMSLYRYVAAKDDLLLLMEEEGVGLPPEDAREAGTWQEGLRRWLAGVLEAYGEHPWLLDLPVSGPPLTPNSLAWLDAALELLSPTPLEDRERISVALMLLAQARWHGHLARVAATGDATDGEPGWAVDGRSAALLNELVTPEQFPHLAPALRSGAFVVDPRAPFDFAVDRILEGVESYVAGRSHGAPAAVPGAAPDPAARDPKVREAVKARREREKQLREARKREREALARARERLAR